MGNYTQHGYSQHDKDEFWWSRPLFGRVSRDKIFWITMRVLAALAIASLVIVAVHYHSLS